MIKLFNRRNTRGKLAVFVMGALVASTSMVQGASALVTSDTFYTPEGTLTVGTATSDEAPVVMVMRLLLRTVRRPHRGTTPMQACAYRR